MDRGHKSGISRRSQQRSGSNRVSNKTGTGTGTQGTSIQGPGGKTHTKAESAVWPSLKYTSISSFRCLTGCKVESLIAGSTRWPPGTAAHKAGESHHCWPVHS
ncbi:unnamed protein product [Staurois parvus]|uniref:Uncharacterized protein n=1 Tax=Staurois parvus TaxID=386267 RepID=A0ABN9FD54_9NEOB|nr:unnamed protein product [Staurois parvus]